MEQTELVRYVGYVAYAFLALAAIQIFMNWVYGKKPFTVPFGVCFGIASLLSLLAAVLDLWNLVNYAETGLETWKFVLYGIGYTASAMISFLFLVTICLQQQDKIALPYELQELLFVLVIIITIMPEVYIRWQLVTHTPSLIAWYGRHHFILFVCDLYRSMQLCIDAAGLYYLTLLSKEVGKPLLYFYNRKI